MTSSDATRDARWGTAVVCGAGMAGLLAATVLAEWFERVVVVERDVLADTSTLRRGVPQAPHIHTLLPGGRRVLDELLPGLVDEVVAAGAVRTCLTSTTKRRMGSGWLPRFESDMWTVICTRPLLEAVVRRHVRRIAGIEWWTGHRAVGVVVDRHRVITGVRGQGSPPGSVPAVLSADLVVDAAGPVLAGAGVVDGCWL